MTVCDTKGRNCIEKNSSNTFNCSIACVGIFASVDWVGKVIEDDIDNEKSDEADLEENIEEGLLKILRLLRKDMNVMKGDIEDVMKIATGERGEEVDMKKYRMLISEYKKFKAKSVKHYRFNSVAAKSTFGKSLLPVCFA